MGRCFTRFWVAAWMLLFIAGAVSPDDDLPLRQLVAGSPPDYRAELSSLYGAEGYHLVWFRGGKVTAQALEIIGVLQRADEKGLVPENYDGPQWPPRLERLTATVPLAVNEIERFDLALSAAVMRYVSDLRVGRVNPKLCHFAFDV